MSAFSAILIKLLPAALVAAIPPLRKLKAERDAGLKPLSVVPINEELLDEAMERLGGPANGESKVLTFVQASAARWTRPAHFDKPFVQEWLATPVVQDAIHRLALAQLTGAPRPQDALDTAVDAYVEGSGELSVHAHGVVDTAVSISVASLQAAVKDTGTAAMVQSGFGLIHDSHDRLERKLDAVKGGLPTNFGAAITEQNGIEARKALDLILRRRATPGRDPISELEELARMLETGQRFALAGAGVKAEVNQWLARLCSNQGNIAKAEQRLATLKFLGVEPTVVTLAWLDVARGEIDAGLRRLASVESDDARSNIFGILRTKRDEQAALSYFDTLTNVSPSTFTAFGWVIVVGCVAGQRGADAAAKILKCLPDEVVGRCPLLAYMQGVVYSAVSTSAGFQGRVIEEQYLYASDHLLDGDEALQWRSDAERSFINCCELARTLDDQLLLKRGEGWLRWLRLVDPVRRKTEVAAITNEMSDGVAAVALISFAAAFDVPFDPIPLERHLAQAEMLGGLTPEQVNANLVLLHHLGRDADLADFIGKNRKLLNEIALQPSIVGTLVQALIRAERWDEAEETLNANLADAHQSDVDRYKLMIDAGRGVDPMAGARRLYVQTRDFIDLVNLVGLLENAKRWSDLTPLALEMFNREPSIKNAVRYVHCLRATSAEDDETLEFLDKAADLVRKEPKLQAAKAWACFEVGRVAEARQQNVELLKLQREDPNDVGLELNLAVRMGDWERLPAILDGVWERRDKLPVALLLKFARLTYASSEARALELVHECVTREPNDSAILLQAYSVAAAMSRDDIAMPFIHRAAALPKGEANPVTVLPIQKVAELFAEQAESWRAKQELFRSGKIPNHMAAALLNVPLSTLLISLPRENRQQGDARKRRPVPIRSARRDLHAPAPLVQKLALDISSIFILSELGLLDKVLHHFAEVHVSARLMEALLVERDKVRFHQPSRIAQAKPMLDALRKGQLSVIEDSRPTDLTREVGDESAELLHAAKLKNGVYAHSGKLYKAGSLMEVEATIGDFSQYLCEVSAVATALRDESLITEVIYEKASNFLCQVSGNSLVDSKLSPHNPVLLDRVSAEYLMQVDLLTPLFNSGRRIFVHRSAKDEWQALADTEPHSNAMAEALERVRIAMKGDIATGKVVFLRRGSLGEKDDRVESSVGAIADLFHDLTLVDAVCIDDRTLNAEAFIEDRKGRRVHLLCSLDILDMLVQYGAISSVERSEAIHTLRSACFFTLPVTAGELFDLLSDRTANANGTLSESAELRTLREYLARLHSANVLCTPSDADYLDDLWRTGQAVIRQLWAATSEANVDIEARADWVVDHVIPDIPLALRHVSPETVIPQNLAVGRLFGALLPTATDAPLQASYKQWLERKVVATYLPGAAGIVDAAAKAFGTWARERSVEMANELDQRNCKDSGADDAGVGSSSP